MTTSTIPITSANVPKTARVQTLRKARSESSNALNPRMRIGVIVILIEIIHFDAISKKEQS